MRVIAATFKDRAVADQLLRDLRAEYELGVDDASLAPLGTADADEPGSLTLLAGRFYDERAPVVRELVERNGGDVVMDIDEAATRRRTTPPPASRTVNTGARAETAPREPSLLFL